MYRFSLIIIHRNGYDRLKNTLESALKIIGPQDEIIVVDNFSNDKSILKIRKNKDFRIIKIIENSWNKGFGSAANIGMRSTMAKFFLICNNDIVLEKNTLEAFEKDFESYPNTGLISGQLKDLDGNCSRTCSNLPSFWSEFDGIAKITNYTQPKKISKVGVVRGACIAVNSRVVDEVGMYDEDFFFYSEDTEWSIRMNKKGYDVMFDPEIFTSHIGGSTTSEVYINSRVEFYKSRMILWDKIFSKPQVLILKLWNYPKLLLDMIFYFLAYLLSLGKIKKYWNKFLDRSVVILWFVLFKPKFLEIPRK